MRSPRCSALDASPRVSGLLIGPPGEQLFAGAFGAQRTLLHSPLQQKRVRAADITALADAQDLHDLASVQIRPDRFQLLLRSQLCDRSEEHTSELQSRQ